MSFPRYPAYKPSGVEWLGEVPEHWEEKPLKTVTSVNDEVLSESVRTDHEIEYVDISSVSLTNGIERTESMIFGDAPSRARRIPRDGDVLVSTVRTYLKAIAPVVSPPSNLVASTGFAVVRPQLGIHPGYLKYSLQEEHFIQQIISRSTGVSYPAINASDIARIRLSLPNQFEQLAIAAFLGRETAKIDALIAEQQHLIELLQEKRQAVISHAVTKGLNPDVPMKDSGVEWLGEVPEHWEATALKRLCRRITDGAHISPETDNGVYCFVSTRDISESGIDFEGCLRTSEESYEYLLRTGCRPEVGDVLFSKDGTIGRTLVVRKQHDFVVASSLIIIRPDTKLLDADFLDFLCKSDAVQDQVESFVKGAGLPRLSIANLMRVIGIFPPLQEQRRIANVVSKISVRFTALMAEAEAAVPLLQERRSALISAAVTGQIDVRELAEAKAEEP